MTSLTLQYERLCPDCLQKLQVGGFLVFLPTTVVEVLVDVEEVVTTVAVDSDSFVFNCVNTSVTALVVHMHLEPRATLLSVFSNFTM